MIKQSQPGFCLCGRNSHQYPKCNHGIGVTDRSSPSCASSPSSLLPPAATALVTSFLPWWYTFPWPVTVSFVIFMAKSTPVSSAVCNFFGFRFPCVCASPPKVRPKDSRNQEKITPYNIPVRCFMARISKPVYFKINFRAEWLTAAAGLCLPLGLY